jgi:phospholipase/carboxylesterase
MGELLLRTFNLPHVKQRESRVATAETCALSLPEELALGPAEAFIDDHEFCHIHPLPEGTIHTVLPPQLRDEAIRSGWAEPHPLAGVGFFPRTLIAIYAPRCGEELNVVMALVQAAYDFALGLP